ncbi:MAG TPA: GAF domain-containing protein, partial [Aggregatilineales bacterium]|nr:GAF domain-containing protein [Aggregatilineales bacterium]
NLFEASFEGIIIHEEGRILDVNPALLKMFGYTSSELIGQFVTIIIAPEDQEPVRMSVAQGREVRHEITGIHRDGTRIEIEVLARNLNYQGRHVRVAAVRDITERRKSDAIKRQQQALTEALRDSAAALNSTLDPETVMNRILDNVGHVVPHDAANIMLIEGDIARTHYWRGYADEHLRYLVETEFRLDEYSTLQYMLRTRMPLSVSDTAQDQAWLERERSLSVRSYAGAPISLDNIVIGFINLDSTTPGALTDLHAEHLMAFADQAAIAIKNARMYDRIRLQTEELQNEILERQLAQNKLARRNLLLETLHEISQGAFAHLGVSQIMDKLAELSAKILDATSAYVCDWDEETGYTTVLAEYMSPNANPRERVSDTGASYRIEIHHDDPYSWIRNPEGYHIHHIDDPELPQHEREFIQGFGGSLALYVPMRVDGEPIGYIVVWDSRPGRTFSKNEIGIMITIARQVSGTIDKARLHMALLESQGRNKAIIDAMPDYMFRLSRGG